MYATTERFIKMSALLLTTLILIMTLSACTAVKRMVQLTSMPGGAPVQEQVMMPADPVATGSPAPGVDLAVPVQAGSIDPAIKELDTLIEQSDNSDLSDSALSDSSLGL